RGTLDHFDALDGARVEVGEHGCRRLRILALVEAHAVDDEDGMLRLRHRRDGGEQRKRERQVFHRLVLVLKTGAGTIGSSADVSAPGVLNTPTPDAVSRLAVGEVHAESGS